MSAPIPPGATLGVLGGGQLGRMFALAARRMGYHVNVFAPEDDTPAGQIAYREVRAPYEDLDAVHEFARSVSVVTFEFENIPSATVMAAAEHAPVRPAGSLLHDTQHRRREREALIRAGAPVTPHASVDTGEQLASAIRDLGTPAVLKTAAWGYDGKGQVRIDEETQASAAWQALDGQPCVLESFVDFEREISVIGVRGIEGETVVYSPVENHHVDHILDLSIAPAEVPARVAERAREITRALLEAWAVVGVICVEMFLLPDGELLVNEVAPRPHNSGHLTIDGHRCNQFEQQVRAVCGLPLGSSEPVSPAAMVNLLGELWQDGAPDWRAALRIPGVSLHLYGKTEARPGRKMGHLTALASSVSEAREKALQARRGLRSRTGV